MSLNRNWDQNSFDHNHDKTLLPQHTKDDQ